MHLRWTFACLFVVARARADDISPPAVVTRVLPELPAGLSGDKEVVVIATLDAEGKVTSVVIDKSAGADLDKLAEDAVAKWTFAPAKKNGVPTAARLRVPIHFASSLPEFQVDPSHAREKNEPPPIEPDVQEVRVGGWAPVPSRGAGDHEVRVGNLALVPRMDAASTLRLAPGIFLTNQGGTGHPYQVFLRGFDAREGQDIEFSVDGIPINDVGNPHGNGLADTNFIIPETVLALRVIEGPYAPQQGNFAVAGSALYDVGLDRTGFRARAMFGSFGVRRLLATYWPEGASEHTFAAAELFATDGFGQNRRAERATAMGGVEIPLGKDTALRALATSYATGFKQAGVLREDDVASGRKGFYDTYDEEQGGDAQRHSLGLTLQHKAGNVRLSQSMFGTLRAFRLRQNFTGFLLDTQRTWQTPHLQRGDLVDQQMFAGTFGGRGFGRISSAMNGLRQELEIGYFARHDRVEGLQQRNRAGSQIPYLRDLDLASALTNLALYADATARVTPWLTARGGLRGDLFHFHVHNRCAVTSAASSNPLPTDTECFSEDRAGYRSPDQTTSTAVTAWQPRGALLFGPFSGATLSLALGTGARSIDPQFINQSLSAPFASALSYEGGASWQRTVREIELSVKTSFFTTKVDKDQFFNQTEGRSTLAGGTTRTGASLYARATGKFFDVAGSLTGVRATFDDTRALVPYAPPLVARLDGALFGDLPFLPAIAGHRARGSIGAGLSYVSKRPLPLGETSDDISLLDAALTIGWRELEIGLTATNLLGREYRIAELNYVSDFRSQGYPTLVASRHFVAGEPTAVFGTFTITLGGEEKK